MPTNRALLDLTQEVRQLCLPHFNKLGLDHFNYIHRDNNGNATYLCSNHTWLKHYLEKSYPNIGAFENNQTFHQHSYILWNGLDRNDPILIDSKEMLGVEYGITIIKQEEDGFGFYNLGKKSSDPAIINQYVNHIDEYENLILLFQENAKNFLMRRKR